MVQHFDAVTNPGHARVYAPRANLPQVGVVFYHGNQHGEGGRGVACRLGHVAEDEIHQGTHAVPLGRLLPQGGQCS